MGKNRKKGFFSSLKPGMAENLNKNYELFYKNYKTAFKELANKDPKKISDNSGAKIFADKAFALGFFKKVVLIDLKENKVFELPPTLHKYVKNSYGLNAGSENINFSRNEFNAFRSLDILSSFLILHFMLNADGAPLSGKWIHYRDLPDGLFYSNTINGVLQPVIEKYEKNGKEFLKKLVELGGIIEKNFKNAGILYPFEKFPLLFIFEEKDEEFEADLKVLFDKSAPHYIKSDIIKTLLLYTVKRIIK